MDLKFTEFLLIFYSIFLVVKSLFFLTRRNYLPLPVDTFTELSTLKESITDDNFNTEKSVKIFSNLLDSFEKVESKDYPLYRDVGR